MKSNKNGVKLLAALTVFAIALAGAIVFIDDDTDVDATSTVTSMPTGQVDVDTIVNLDSGVNTPSISLTTTNANGVTITVNYTAENRYDCMFTGGSITVGDKVKLILNLTADSVLRDCHILNNTALTISNGGEVVFKQSANAQGQSWYNSETKNLDLGGTLTIDGANGFSGVAATLAATAKIDVKSTTSSAAALNFTSYTDNAGAKINVSDATVFPYFSNSGNTAATTTVKGEINAPNSVVKVEAGTLAVDGKVTASSILPLGTSKVTTGASGQVAAEVVATSINHAAQIFATTGSVSEITISGEQTLSSDIYIPANKTLILNGATVKNDGTSYIIIVDGELQSNAAYIYCGVYINETGTFTGINTHSNIMTGTMVDDYKVGFGDKLVLTGTIPAGVTLDAYGAVTLNDVTVSGTVKTYVGSTMDIQGTVTISNAFTINAGAEIELSGTITVKNDANGGASLTLQNSVDKTDYNSDGDDLKLISKLAIAEGGVLKINKPTSNAATSTNSLVVGSDAQLVVEGTLDITGTLSGTIQDKGTVLFNGTAAAAGATIVLYDGISITVGSVTGALTITDAGIVADIDPNATATNIADGNQVILTNVKNVTVSEEVTTKVNKTNTTKFYICNMSVSGSVTKVNGITDAATLEITASADTVTIDGTATNTGMNIVDTLTIGKSVAVTTNGKVTLKGTVSAMEETSGSITITTGSLTVSGQLYGKTANIDKSSGATINAVYYTITTISEGATSTVCYYTGFAQAANAIGDADEDTITVLGSVSMSADAEIAPQMTVAVPGTLTIKDGYTLTIDDGALLSVTGQVTVSGTLVIVNSDTGLTIGKLAYDTSRVNGKTVTYTNLANALAGASEGDVITLAQGVTLSKAVTIPEGVTVQTGKYTVTMKDGSSLKVDGTFAIQNGGSVVKATDASQWGDEVKITVNGVMTSTTSYAYDPYKISGAYFTLKGVNYITNLAYAAEKVDDGSVTVYGTVSAGDVTFTEKENGTLTITVTGTDTALSVSSITLDGATLVINDAAVTGDIIAASGDSDAKITFNKASKVTVDSGVRSVGTEYVDCMYLYGYTTTVAATQQSAASTTAAATLGSVTVAEGTVYISNVTTSGDDYSVAGKDNVLKVASGATLVVTGKVSVGDSTDKKSSAVIDGTLNIVGNVNVTGIMEVSGTVNIAKDNTSGNAKLVVYANSTPGKLIVTGTVNISEDEDNIGTFEVGVDTGDKSGYVILGEKPTQIGATGAIVGKVTLLENSYIKVYDGASVADAKINWSNDESTAVSTVFYINGTPYVTAYAAYGSEVKLVGTNSVIASDWVNENVGLGITGIVTKDANNLDKWFSDEALTAPVTSNKIGGTEKIYFDAPISEAEFKVSVGTGMSLWIDGIKYVSGSTASLTVGDHKVQVIINPGYKGTSSVSVNGQTVTDKVTVTVAMVGQDNVITVIGDIAIDAGDTPAPVEPTEKDDGMGITDYLLIILVVLAAILVVIVAIRMMRS